MNTKNRWNPIRLLVIAMSLTASMLMSGCEQDVQEIETDSEIDTSVPGFEGTFITDEKDVSPDARYELLRKKFATYQVYNLDLQSLSGYVTNQSGKPFKLIFSDEFQWEMNLESNGILAPEYTAYGESAGGRTEMLPISDVFYKGNTGERGKITITLDDHLINAMIRYEGELVFIENVSNLGKP